MTLADSRTSTWAVSGQVTSGYARIRVWRTIPTLLGSAFGGRGGPGEGRGRAAHGGVLEPVLVFGTGANGSGEASFAQASLPAHQSAYQARGGDVLRRSCHLPPAGRHPTTELPAPVSSRSLVARVDLRWGISPVTLPPRGA